MLVCRRFTYNFYFILEKPKNFQLNYDTVEEALKHCPEKTKSDQKLIQLNYKDVEEALKHCPEVLKNKTGE
jgi:ferredoxin